MDYFKCSAWKAALPVSIIGILVTIAYTSNAGWIVFDMTEHFILRYIVIAVGFLQCISVGWFFEYHTTAIVSPEHNKSLKCLALMYWLPTIVICFYSNFGLESNKIWGLVVISGFTLLSLICSFLISKMEFNSWYHEIVLQGVDKLSMSITSLSNANGKRSIWMIPFETYFGICIKFINPACLLFIFFHNLYEDLTWPYNEQTQRMYMFATIPVFAAILIIVIPIFTCGHPEVFQHNVNNEFMADVLYEKKLRLANQAKEQFSELQRLKQDTTGDLGGPK